VINIFSSGKITTIFTNRIMFPILDINGYILGFSGRSIDKKADEQGTKYINSKENEIFKKNEIFYNINNIDIRECETLIIVEGFMDAIAYYRAGYHNVVATMGVAFSEAHIKVLKSFSKLKNIVLSFDNDATGEAANYRVGTILAKEKFDLFCCRITEPEIKDVDELLKKRGEVKVKEMFDNKQDFFVFYIDYMLNEIETLSEKNKKTTEVLEFISKYIDILSVDTYLEAISKKTNIKLENLKLKFSQLIGKPIHTIGQPTPVKKEYKASTPRQAASTKFNYNVNAEKTMSDKINATIETKKNSISRGIDELIASSFINIAAFIYLVNQLPSPTYINDLNKRNIIKIIKLVYERDKTIEHITIDDVNQLSKELKLEDSPHYDL
jgi:DNA primase